MGRQALARRLRQLLQQGMPEHHEARLAPQRPQIDDRAAVAKAREVFADMEVSVNPKATVGAAVLVTALAMVVPVPVILEKANVKTLPRAVFDKVGPFDARLRSAGDWEWCLRAARNGHPVTYCAEAVVSHPTRKRWRDG